MPPSPAYQARAVLMLSCLLLATLCPAQTSQYLADLAALKTVLQQTRSYKAQIRGDKERAYQALYRQLALDTVSDPRSLRYFTNLARLVFPLRDNHLGFHQTTDFKQFSTQARIDSFTTTREFKAYPRYVINLDSLRGKLRGKPLDSLAGIYHYGELYSVGVFGSGPGEYTGVVLESKTRLWQPGQIALRLYAHAPGRYKAIYGHPLFKILMLQPVERYVNHSLVNSSFYGSSYEGVYAKEPGQPPYVTLPRRGPKFAFRDLDQKVQYLLIRSFQQANARRSRAFYDSVRQVLRAPNLIVDLRDNEGGSDKEARKYVKLLRRYARQGHQLYVLLNNGTLSQAEILTLKLAGRRGVRTAGQTTRGMLGYGSNYGRMQKLPSGQLEIYPTDMDNGARLLRYEDYGVEPQLVLRPDSSWIDQLLKIIHAQEAVTMYRQ
ncbi:S41 family peptidase [Fibrella forsythiae]|uniref:Tail specific protease domain-containing protein n=1 Tax=Fibrella forsythiae TaxID=2817061 RepID=A0ABS3JUH2_9BACT|nr:S41 family peptidase [Fibrella forsythiae]MBO0953098.1 hypothetical protein [Fibrella forsythiae]